MRRVFKSAVVALVSVSAVIGVYGTSLAGQASMTGSQVNYTANAWNTGFPIASGHHVSGTIKDTASNSKCAGALLSTAVALAPDPSTFRWNCGGNTTSRSYTWEPQHANSGGMDLSSYTGAKFQPVNGNNGSASEWGTTKTCNAGTNC